MNDNNYNIKQQIRQKSINKAMQNYSYNEIPSWVPMGSWIISAILSFIMIITLISENDITQENNIFGSLIGFLFFVLIIKSISYTILLCIFHTYSAAKKGTCIAINKSSKAIDNFAVGVVKKAQSIRQKATEENKIEHEKQILKNRINDLELQKLKRRVAELEEELNNKQ